MWEGLWEQWSEMRDLGVSPQKWNFNGKGPRDSLHSLFLMKELGSQPGSPGVDNDRSVPLSLEFKHRVLHSCHQSVSLRAAEEGPLGRQTWV